MNHSVRSTFQLHLPGFDGTLEELARRVERRHMAPGQLPLTDITRQFSGYMEREETLDLAAVAEFVSTVSRLMLWKSRTLLLEDGDALEHEEAPPRDSMKDEDLLSAAASLRLREGRESFSSPSRPIEKVREPFPPTLLRRTWFNVQDRSVSAAVEVAVPAFVRLEVALSRVVRSLRARARLRFTRFIQGSNRNDAVVHFLALLELIRRGDAIAVQQQPFGEIDCTLRRQDETLESRIG